MLSLLLILALFGFYTLVGQAALSTLRVRFGVLWSWFLSPTLGMGITILAVNCWSKWGQPVKIAGPWVTVGLALASIAVVSGDGRSSHALASAAWTALVYLCRPDAALIPALRARPAGASA